MSCKNKKALKYWHYLTSKLQYLQGIVFLTQNNNFLAQLRMTPLLQSKKIDEALHFVAQKSWQREKEIFPGLVRLLASQLEADHAFVTTVLDIPNKFAETLVLYSYGNIAENICYHLAHTPCEEIFGESLCIYTERVQQQFPKDKLLADMNAESYIGIPLWNSKGAPIGLIGIIDSKRMKQAEVASTILQIVAVRASADA